MATISGDIEKRVRFLLHDTGLAGGERFTDADIRAFITLGLRDILVRKPLAFVIRRVVQLVPGHEQQLPADGVSFAMAVRNYGLAGTTPGSAIIQTTLADMDAADPNWVLTPPSDVVIQAMPDFMRTRFYYVFPPQPATPGYVEIAFIPEVTPITQSGDVIPIITLFDNALVNYVCHRLSMADSESEANASMNKMFFEHYMAALGK